jgi:hypothetical protein
VKVPSVLVTLQFEVAPLGQRAVFLGGTEKGDKLLCDFSEFRIWFGWFTHRRSLTAAQFKRQISLTKSSLRTV